MLRDIRKNKIFNRRALIIGAGQTALASALVTRLTYLQLWKHREYSIQSDSNRIKPMINPAPRGTCLRVVFLTKMTATIACCFILKQKKQRRN